VGVQKGGTGASSAFSATPHLAGETLFLVGKYDFTVSPNRVTLWPDPDPSTFGGSVDPAATLTNTSGVDGYMIDRFNMRQNTAASVPAAMQWDELRVGRSWADVTPPPPAALTELKRLGSGSFQFTYTNGSAVTYHVFASSNLINWASIGVATQISPGQYQFTDTTATNLPLRFYQLRSP
jgi:hypothetical protein